jgi:uncharacterized protein (TIGR00251 family)
VKISVKVKPNSRLTVVRKIDDTLYTVNLTARPVDGKANEQLVEILADYFGKPKRCITILRGETSKLKMVEIL